MSGETSSRPLLPQNPQTSTISFAPPAVARQENGQRSYVFVDEHNRHKRLKVMRACEGCRRRKIKCDAATTNIWPCSACTRLKGRCVPPAIDGDTDLSSGIQPYDTAYDDTALDFIDSAYHPVTQNNGFEGGEMLQNPYLDNPLPNGDYLTGPYNMPPNYVDQQSYPSNNGSNQPTPSDHLTTPYSTPDQSYPSLPPFQTPPTQPPSETAESWHSTGGATTKELGDALGALKIDESGVAPYISQQRKQVAEILPQGDIDDLQIPYIPVGSDLKIKIPPEYMPSDTQALYYFSIFFNDVHPYVPVLDKHKFYEDWYHNRESISPLILEAIFACAGRLSNDPAQGTKWLTLAGRHADSFMDVSRLSTIQALLIILKARESAPKRGYYFRSWMTVKTIVTLAIELGLDEHMALHREGKPCCSSPPDCLVKTRVWQTCFVCELMIGAPQGRLDMLVDPKTVESKPPEPVPGLDPSDILLSQNFGLFTGIVRSVREMNDVWGRVRKNKAWGIDPELVGIGPSFEAWFNNLPQDMWITYPPGNSPPKLRNHFIGNLHSYYHLSLIMLHRPQLAYTENFAANGEWRRHMSICYSSAKTLCRLQEAILQQFKLQGLLCMQRGINFTIYTILTCTVLHLVALTSPDPEFNIDAKDYFTRHMRILESCTSSWPMPEMQAQIDALREAFSADVTKPFELKRSFPYINSPSFSTEQSFEIPAYTNEALIPQTSTADSSTSLLFVTNQIHTPGSSGSFSTRDGSPAAMPHFVSQPQSQQTDDLLDFPAWNPSRIFDQWNTAFGAPPSTSPPPTTAPIVTGLRIPAPVYHSPPLPTNTSPNANSLHTPPPQSQPDATQIYFSPPQRQQKQQQHSARQQVSANVMATTSSSAVPAPTFVSPMMWQESVASVYDAGMKRRWEDFGGAAIVEGLGVKRPR
ncbi:MAG: hypothetical protein M1814_003621 [Vezdaea aestivalis]|nr:MAG: hypothetical protein M1814_003621 [Vezdaea aestivalis]